MGYPPEIHIHIHPEGDSRQPVSSPSPEQRKPGKAPVERPRVTNIKDSMAQTWYRREMYKVFQDGYPIWEKLQGSKRVGSVDMGVEDEGPEMDFLRILKRANGAFQAGYAMGLKAEKQAKVIKEKAIESTSRHPEAIDNILEFSADLMDAMPVGQERRSELKAGILTQEMALTS